jgi:hypothetical protein
VLLLLLWWLLLPVTTISWFHGCLYRRLWSTSRLRHTRFVVTIMRWKSTSMSMWKHNIRLLFWMWGKCLSLRYYTRDPFLFSSKFHMNIGFCFYSTISGWSCCYYDYCCGVCYSRSQYCWRSCSSKRLCHSVIYSSFLVGHILSVGPVVERRLLTCYLCTWAERIFFSAWLCKPLPTWKSCLICCMRNLMSYNGCSGNTDDDSFLQQMHLNW